MCSEVSEWGSESWTQVLKVSEMKWIACSSHHSGHTSVIDDVDSQPAHIPGIDVGGVRVNGRHVVWYIRSSSGENVDIYRGVQSSSSATGKRVCLKQMAGGFIVSDLEHINHSQFESTGVPMQCMWARLRWEQLEFFRRIRCSRQTDGLLICKLQPSMSIDLPCSACIRIIYVRLRWNSEFERSTVLTLDSEFNSSVFDKELLEHWQRMQLLRITWLGDVCLVGSSWYCA
jgi:hypothetical protein